MIDVSRSGPKHGSSRLGTVSALALMFVWGASIGSAAASGAIRNELGDPYNRPPNLPKPHMICAIGEDATRLLCPARLAPPLSPCMCFGTSAYGRRYFILKPRLLPTIFSFDGYAW